MLSSKTMIYFQTFYSIDFYCSIVMDSNGDSGVIFSIVQNWPTITAVCTKIPKIFFFDKIKLILYQQARNSMT